MENNVILVSPEEKDPGHHGVLNIIVGNGSAMCIHPRKISNKRELK